MGLSIVTSLGYEALILDCRLQCAYVDAYVPESLPEELRDFGLRHVVCWVPKSDAEAQADRGWAGAIAFSRAFFRILRGAEGVTVSEAYAVAAAATEMQASGVLGNLLGPSLVSKNKALLPDHTDVAFSRTRDSAALQKIVGNPENGWRMIRLIAPRAQVSLCLRPFHLPVPASDCLLVCFI
jgi:hypothetical protein